MAESEVKVKVSKPDGASEAADQFYKLAEAANDAAAAVSKAQSAGAAYSKSVRRENGDIRGERRAARAAAQEEERKKQKAEREAAAKTAAKEREQKYRGFAAKASGFAGGGAIGGIAALGPKGAAVAAAMAAVGTVIDKVSTAATILNDSYATGAQKTRALVSEFVPFGEKLIKLSDALDGTADAIKRNEEKFNVLASQDSYLYSSRAKIAGAAGEQFAARAQVAANKRYGIAGFETFDRSTLAGERGAQAQDTTIGAQDELTKAVREAAAARTVAQQAAAKAKEQDKLVAQRQAAFNAAQGRLDANTRYENRGFRDKAGRDLAGRDAARQSDLLSKQLAERERIVAEAKQKGAAAVQAEAQARAASVNLAKAELAVLQQQESRMKSLAQSVGAMNPGERMAAANALKAYQDNGGNAPPEIEALVAKLAPDLVRKNQERRGAAFLEGELGGTIGADGMKAAFGDDFGRGNTLKEVMAKVDRAKADIRVTIDLDTQSTAQQLADLLAPVLENLKATFKIEMQNIEKRIKAGNVVRNNAAN